MREAVEGTVQRRGRSIARSAMEVLGPARRHSARSVGVGDGTTIGEKAIRAVPSDVDLEQSSHRSKPKLWKMFL